MSHIPFLGDSVDDTEFCKDLMQTFPDGIHGTAKGYDHMNDYMNDFILYYTIKGINNRFPSLSMKLCTKFNIIISILGQKAIYKSFYKLFPNKATVHQLRSM